MTGLFLVAALAGAAFTNPCPVFETGSLTNTSSIVIADADDNTLAVIGPFGDVQFKADAGIVVRLLAKRVADCEAAQLEQEEWMLPRVKTLLDGYKAQRKLLASALTLILAQVDVQKAMRDYLKADGDKNNEAGRLKMEKSKDAESEAWGALNEALNEYQKLESDE